MYEPPVSRRLRVLTFDPSLMTRLETETVNELTLSIPWEKTLEQGPIGEYVEVIDYDPASGVFYRPIDLNHPHLLAQDGVQPSESNPQFHQQMVYAVAMTTIRHFERALGRVAFWSDRKERRQGQEPANKFVQRLRIYPHALRERNAYYSPAKKALLFGYFPVTTKDEHNTPGTLVFSCLSHDIIAHEVTHALLDGVHPRFNEPTNADVFAFHEAFADIVALFQHFSYPAVLENQIARTRGKLQTENLLSQLAQQFGQATGRGGALRDALGGKNEQTGLWEPRRPNPHALVKEQEAHARGSILVAAVFRAFLLIYEAATADLFRIASSGTGVLPEGDLHPDLTRRLAYEAAKCANRVLQMCIRAIDYCPPVDITFGDFLRGIITADIDYVPDDTAGYRTVFIQSFREWGIHPRGVTSLGVDALVWPSGDEIFADITADESRKRSAREDMQQNWLDIDREDADWNLQSDRLKVWKIQEKLRQKLWYWLRGADNYGRLYAEVFGLVIEDSKAPRTVYRSERYGEPTVEVHSVRPALRKDISGGVRTDLVVEITQRRRGYFDPKEQDAMDQPGAPLANNEHGDFIYRAGATILIDQLTNEVRRVIRTPGTIESRRELDRIRNYLLGRTGDSDNAFDAGLISSIRTSDRRMRNEPFAFLHSRLEELT